MAVYKIFPTKDNYISSKIPLNNYGRDEILEISNNDNEKTKTLIQFNNNDIEYCNIISNNLFSSSLKLYLAFANNTQPSYSISVSPLSQSWEMGTGRNGDNPNPKNGSCWLYPNINNINDMWDSSSYSQTLTQSFNYTDSLDIDCDITPIVKDWVSGTVPNYGVILENLNNSTDAELKYFSMDTHTIYPPHIEFKWVDVSYSSSLPIINNTDFQTYINNNKFIYTEDEIIQINIQNRDLYPARNFQTSSLYLNNKILPESTLWSLKDIKSNEIVIDYDSIGTKVGSNNNGNYFNLYMNGLQPNRYYQILIKTEINNNVIIIEDSNHVFKIVK